MSEKLETRLSVRCDDETKRLLAKFAEQRDITTSEAIRLILNNAIDLLELRGVLQDDDIAPNLFL